MHIAMSAPRLAASGKEARFGVGARPIAGPPVQAPALGELDPDERQRLVSEAPGLDQLKSLREVWPGRPQEQRAILGGELADRQRLELLERHGAVVPIGRSAEAALRPGLKLPGRVGEDYAEAAAGKSLIHTMPSHWPPRFSTSSQQC